MTTMTPVDEAVAAQIRRSGPIPFEAVMDLALYHPAHGFYASGGFAGRRGDFITSSEVGPLFGAVLGRALDEWWRELGEPDPFVVVEGGAGVGTLARTILAGAPDCLAPLTYVLVERSDSLRAAHGDHLSLSDATAALGPSPHPISGPRFVSLADLPSGHDVTATGGVGRGPVVHVVLANELLDNLAAGLVEWRDGTWWEVCLGLRSVDGDGDGDDDDSFVELLAAATASDIDVAAGFVADPRPGARVPISRGARAWLHRAFGLVERGRVVVIDYGDRTPSLATRPAESWLRTYRAHERGTHPLRALGTQDITCEVAIDQLEAWFPDALVSRQRDFLSRHGIDELVDEGRRIWHERAAIGDLAAMMGRSRVREAEALTDAEGLGAFWVLEWPDPGSRRQAT